MSARIWLCAIGAHRWRRVTFKNAPGVHGRYCRRCKRLQHFMPRIFGRDWRDTGLTPNEDAHGYY